MRSDRCVKKLRVATYGRGMWQIDLPSPDIQFYSLPISFTAVLGRSSAAQQVTLTNNSAGPVTIGSITVSGEYSVGNNCPAVLSSTASCTVTVVFTPLSSGARVNTLTLNSNAAGPARTLTLNGNGLDFNVALKRPSRSGRNGGTVAATMLRTGESATVEASISAGGAGGLSATETTVALECADVPAGMRCEVKPSEINLASSSAAKVTISQVGAMQARRLSRGTVGNYTLQLRVKSGTVTRSAAIPVTVVR